MAKNIYIIAGCNGAGKTTASYTILPELHCLEFVNADEIAKGISPFQPEKVAIQAGKLMLQRIDELLKNNISFAFETTLSTKSYKNTLLKAKQNGYNINLLFFWLQTVELAKERVAKRVSEGGHNIDEDIIERRYYRGIQNLFEIYLPISDIAFIFDNSENERELMLEKNNNETNIIDKNKYSLLETRL
jgi:predicted ABC-type ATPase